MRKKVQEVEEKVADNDRDSMAEDALPSSKKSTNDETDAPGEGQESPQRLMGKS